MDSAAPGRVALFSIKPEYATAILSGSKTVEFRRTALAPDVTHVVIYATAPVQRIVGTFEVDGVERALPADLWSIYEEVGGIGREAYDGYFAGARAAYAIRVSKPRPLAHPVMLKELEPGLRPPQSYQYLRDDALDKVGGWLCDDPGHKASALGSVLGVTAGLLERGRDVLKRLTQ